MSQLGAASAVEHGRPQRSVTWATRLALLLLGLALPVLLLECALRAFGPILPGNYSAHLYLEPHPVYGHFHVPGTSGWLKSQEYVTRVDINSRGLREREIAYDKPADIRRIIVLGDSFVAGAEVPVEATLTRRLEARLNAGGAETTQVINAGVRGFGTAQEYLLLKHEALRYSPDLVAVVFYTGNDVMNNGYWIKDSPRERDRPYFVLADDGQLRLLPFQAKRRPREGWLERLRRESLLFGVLDTGVLAKLGVAQPAQAEDEGGDGGIDRSFVKYQLPVYSAKPSRAWEKDWQVAEALLAQMRDEAEKAGARFLLVNAPTKWAIYPEDWDELQQRLALSSKEWDLDAPDRRLAEIAARRDIAYIDLRAPLRDAAAAGPRLYYRQDVHWTVAGQQVVADALAGVLTRGTLLSTKQPPS